jgi:type VI secretion system protein ImpH
MGTDNRRQPGNLSQAIRDCGPAFAFEQVVRVLDAFFAGQPGADAGRSAVSPAVGLRGRARLDFPTSDVAEVCVEHDRASVVTNFLSLAGCLGPLPLHVTEQITQGLARGDRSLQDFLDIFHHRLLSLWYQTAKQHRPVLDSNSIEQTSAGRALMAVAGVAVGSAGPDQRQARAVVRYAGLLAGGVRSPAGLAAMLGDYFDTQCQVVALVGRWRDLPADQQTRLGQTGQTGAHHALGEAALGGRYWDQQAGFEIQLGPVSLAQYRSLLPDRRQGRMLARLVRLYASDEFDWSVRLRLRAREVPALRLGGAQPVRLGWNSWLGRTPAHCGAEAVFWSNYDN